MIDYNDLINRIESMQDLPVSEEMIGAYCEGSLSPIDAAAMDSCIANDTRIGELVDSVDNSQVSDNLYTFGYGIDNIGEINLPNVPMSNAINPFGIDTISNIDDIGMVAAAASPAFNCISDDTLLDHDNIISGKDSFPANDTSFDMENNINKENSLDDLSVNNDNTLI